MPLGQVTPTSLPRRAASTPRTSASEVLERTDSEDVAETADSCVRRSPSHPPHRRVAAWSWPPPPRHRPLRGLAVRAAGPPGASSGACAARRSPHAPGEHAGHRRRLRSARRPSADARPRPALHRRLRGLDHRRHHDPRRARDQPRAADRRRRHRRRRPRLRRPEPREGLPRGIFIIMEDQYGVGDIIDVGDLTAPRPARSRRCRCGPPSCGR